MENPADWIMRTIAFILVALFLPLLLCTTLYAADTYNTHPYKIRAYIIGAFVDDKDSQQSSGNFESLLITGTASDILNNQQNTTVSLGEANSQTANSKGFALSAKFEANSKLSVLGAFGMTKNLWTPDSIDFENKSSWEANLGLIYKLVDHLSYELHFGYMDTGDLFYDRSSYSDVESIIMISNRLTLSF